jgi:hypothetical protein
MPIRISHHLSDVLDQPASPGMVICSRCRSPPESLAKLGQEDFTNARQSRICDRAERFRDVIEIDGLLFPYRRWSAEQ